MTANNIKKTDWLNIKQFCETRIKELRIENDSDLDEKATTKIRGKIEFALEILDFDKKETVLEITNTKYIE